MTAEELIKFLETMITFCKHNKEYSSQRKAEILLEAVKRRIGGATSSTGGENANHIIK